jgi:hypothetical protein
MRSLVSLLELIVLRANVLFDRQSMRLQLPARAWDLYILSLRQLQQTNQNDSLSYFQIAGKFSTTHSAL